jgi:hypothetical protein
VRGQKRARYLRALRENGLGLGKSIGRSGSRRGAETQRTARETHECTPMTTNHNPARFGKICVDSWVTIGSVCSMASVSSVVKPALRAAGLRVPWRPSRWRSEHQRVHHETRERGPHSNFSFQPSVFLPSLDCARLHDKYYEYGRYVPGQGSSAAIAQAAP